MQARRQQFYSVDCGAVKDPLGALIALRALPGYLSFARQHIICQFLPVAFPIAALALELLKAPIKLRNHGGYLHQDSP
jgi:hypothetical protein